MMKKKKKKKKKVHIKDPARTVRMHNLGPGWCQVTKISYSYALTQ